MDINAQGPGVYGNLLQTAVWMGHEENVQFLLDHGANARIEGRFGTAIGIARRGIRFRSLSKELLLRKMLGDWTDADLGESIICSTQTPSNQVMNLKVTNPTSILSFFGGSWLIPSVHGSTQIRREGATPM